jgi:hypothetical protein
MIRSLRFLSLSLMSLPRLSCHLAPVQPYMVSSTNVIIGVYSHLTAKLLDPLDVVSDQTDVYTLIQEWV